MGSISNQIQNGILLEFKCQIQEKFLWKLGCNEKMKTTLIIQREKQTVKLFHCQTDREYFKLFSCEGAALEVLMYVR